MSTPSPKATKRNISAPRASGNTDPAKGKDPLDWKVVQDDFKAHWSTIADPVKQAAKEGYESCVKLSGENGVKADDVFLKSCKDWLAANK